MGERNKHAKTISIKKSHSPEPMRFELIIESKTIIPYTI